MCPAKRLLFLVPLLPCFASQGAEWDILTDVTVGSMYVDRGLQLGEATVQSTVELAYADFYAGAWSALPQGGQGAGGPFEDEFNLYLGYGWALGEKSFLDVGATRIVTPHAEDSSEFYAGWVGEWGILSPALYVFRDVDVEESAAELSVTVAVPEQVLPLEFRVFGGGVEADGGDGYLYYGLDAYYSIRLGESSSIRLGGHFADHDLSEGDGGEHFYATASFTLNW